MGRPSSPSETPAEREARLKAVREANETGLSPEEIVKKLGLLRELPVSHHMYGIRKKML